MGRDENQPLAGPVDNADSPSTSLPHQSSPTFVYYAAQPPPAGSSYQVYPTQGGCSPVVQEHVVYYHDYYEQSHCWTYYWRAPVHWRTYALIFYFLLVDLPFSLFSFVWTLVTFVVGCVLTPVCLVGIPILFVSAYSWRILAKVDLKLKQTFCDDPYNPDPYVHYASIQGMPSVIVKCKHGRGHFKSLMRSGYTWRSFLYLTCVKLFFAIGTFVITAIIVVASLSSLPVGVLIFVLLAGLIPAMGRGVRALAVRILCKERNECSNERPVPVGNGYQACKMEPAAAV